VIVRDKKVNNGKKQHQLLKYVRNTEKLVSGILVKEDCGRRNDMKGVNYEKLKKSNSRSRKNFLCSL
jgi:hypothetical protein